MAQREIPRIDGAGRSIIDGFISKGAKLLDVFFLHYTLICDRRVQHFWSRHWKLAPKGLVKVCRVQ